MPPSRHAVPVPLTAPGLPDLPPELAGPVGVALAKPVRAMPASNALPGGCRYEPKWDGYRLVVVRDDGSCDEAATDALRAERRAARTGDEPFLDRGPGYARLSGGAAFNELDLL